MLIRPLLDLYIIVLIVDAILSYFPKQRASQFGQWIKVAADLTLRPIRKILPKDLPVDISPLIVIVVIKLVVLLW